MAGTNEMGSVEGQLVGLPLAGPESFSVQQLAYLKKALGLDETILYSGVKSISGDGTATYTLSESPLNFQYIKVYWCASGNDVSESGGNKGVGVSEWDPQIYTSDNTFISAQMNGTTGTSFTRYDVSANLSGIRSTSWDVQGSLNSATSNALWFHIYKIVGIHRIAGGN